MKILDLFFKPINRNINGVIKVSQQDDASIFQELDEYVITQELNKHFQIFFDRYTNALNTPTDKMGVWISGFFGSGKSHFLKILSYLLENRIAKDDQGQAKEAVDFFDENRIANPMVLAQIIQSTRVSTDVILFNIDSKADANSKNQKDSIVKVFQKVFDDHLGYFGTVPAIAEFERRLDQRGQFEDFKGSFQESSGQKWEDCRDAWLFHQDDITQALMQKTGMGEEAANRLVEEYDKNYTLSPEKFSQTVRDYLATKGPKHRLIFMVDEVGQYMGENPDLMLNLQTVVEDLGIHCRGQAWVMVTSQEAMDEITKNRIRGNDFSKIVGRFYRPLSLSSANTDEVIKLRLLKKHDFVYPLLETLYHDKQAILKNQISFTQDCAELPGYRNVHEFIAAYPFIPYQFTLLQKVFTQIRLMGSAGKHLASGERSLLDAFQIAAKEFGDRDLGALIPFHTFYLAIEGFLDSNISQVIEQGGKNEQLQPGDIDLLKTLFMIKYVKEVRANLDNLTTLSLEQIDQDKLLLRDRLAESLGRLEKQILIQRVGDEYTFLTHEEQDIGREIKNIRIDPGDVTTEFQTLVWESIFTDKKLKYDNRHLYGFNRKLDEQNFGAQIQDFCLHVITPYADRYRELQEDAACLLATLSAQEVFVRLPDDAHLLDEVNNLVQTAKYIRKKNSTNLPESIRTILQRRTDENSSRRDRVQKMLEKLIAQASVFACGNKVEISNRETKSVLTEGLVYLIDNVYTKLNYIQSHFDTEDQVSHALIRDSQEQMLDGNPPNGAAYQEMKTWLADEQRSHRRVTIRGLIDRFTKRPYGWSEFDTLGILAELINLGKIELRRAQETINPQEKGLTQRLRSKAGLDENIVRLCDEVDPASLRIAQNLAHSLLTVEAPPSEAIKLYETYQQVLTSRLTTLKLWLASAEKENLPFGALLTEKIEFLGMLLERDGAADFFGQVKHQQESIEDFIDDWDLLTSFFEQQLSLFQDARRSLSQLEPELPHLPSQELMAQVQEIRRILALTDPTPQIPRLGMLLKPIQDAVKNQLSHRVQQAQDIGNQVQLRVREYVQSAYGVVADQLDIETLIKPVEKAIASAGNAATIDSAIARQSELENLETCLIEQLDQQATELLNKGDTPQSKPIKAVKLASFSDRSILETEDQVRSFIETLEQKLVEVIQQGDRIRLE